MSDVRELLCLAGFVSIPVVLGCLVGFPLRFLEEKREERILTMCLESGNYTIDQCVSLVEKEK